MRFILGMSLALCGILLVSFVAGTTPARAAAPSASVTILFDLGDGTYVWSSLLDLDPTAVNATWDTVLTAAANAGLYVRSSWYACCGVFIQDVGNRSPPSGAVALFRWDAVGRAWHSASVGVSSMVLEDGDVIALSDNGFDPVTFGPIFPVPTPDQPYPATEFRSDAAGSGSSPSESPSLLALAWDADLHLQEIPASPAVAYGRVYVLTLDGLFALDESKGTVLWSNTAVAGLSTPAVFNGTVIFGGRDGRVHSVNATDGREIWNTSLIAQPGFSGITSSPKLLFDTLYIGTFNESGGAGEVAALRATNGAILWRHPAPASVSFSSPAVADGRVVVGIIGRYNTSTQVTYDPPYGVLALDAANGSQVWYAPTGGSVAASPAVSGGRVFAPSKDGTLYALNAADGSVAWESSVQAGVSSPAVAAGLVIAGGGSFASGGRVVALNATTGAPAWTFPAGGPVQSSITYSDRMVFFATNAANGTIYAANAASGILAWRYTPQPTQFIFATPTVADGGLFAASDNGHVYAFRPASVDLAAAVNATAPTQLAAGQTGNVTVRVSAPNGTWEHVWTRVNLPDGLDIVAMSPPASINGRQLTVDLGPLLFQTSTWFNVTVRANDAGVGSSRAVEVQVNLAAANDLRFGSSPAIPPTRIVSSVSPGGDPTVVALAVGLAIAALLAAVVVILLFRRRYHRP